MDGCEILWLSMCSFAAPYRKDTRLGLVRIPFLRPLWLSRARGSILTSVCRGLYAPKRPGTYPDGFAQECAACAYAAFMKEAPALGHDSTLVRTRLGGPSWFGLTK